MKDLIKLGGVVVGVLFAMILGFNCYTIVDAGTTKVGTIMGEVQDKPLEEGLHFVNPMMGFDVFDTRNNKFVKENLLLPTKDRFNSTANVTVLYRVDNAKTPYIKKNYGTMEMFVDKAMSQFLTSIIKDEGRKISDSRGLADSFNVTAMQENTKRRLQEALTGTGITLQDVLIQDVTFDPRIQNQILQTQDRIQKEEAEKSQLRIAQTTAKRTEETAKGQAAADKAKYEANAYKTFVEAKAYADGVKQKADAERYMAEQTAIGNNKLASSLTPQIVELKRIEVQMKQAGAGWNGQVPANFTLMGQGQAPLFLKQMQ
ncbi:hypothetical protein phiAS5_ORF0192 [Aeromonas phage phiAS5]|uniref:Band 7 domain-containing protein n=1 Tax=Aeromonas phage phiAS5 TaxID=879630 RepID=E1A2T9_9CAUD|nr:lipoprotein [Aeromonas phage phiAS5]ADM80035.1 hypothetical protein phiAS5_ORF0192 [Aeromonas phage phiAS5]